jgi:hypothetical protein
MHIKLLYNLIIILYRTVLYCIVLSILTSSDTVLSCLDYFLKETRLIILKLYIKVHV